MGATMQLFVIADVDGRIVAAHHITDTGPSEGGVHVRLMARPGQHEHVVEVPSALADSDPHDTLAALHREYRINDSQLVRTEQRHGI